MLILNNIELVFNIKKELCVFDAENFTLSAALTS